MSVYNPEQFMNYLKEWVEDEAYDGDFNKCQIIVSDVDSDSRRGEVMLSMSITIEFESPVRLNYHNKELRALKIREEAEERIRKEVYGK